MSGPIDFENISTHTPHARRDIFSVDNVTGVNIFLLTRLMRGVTSDALYKQYTGLISTHTPHARRDRKLIADIPRLTGFLLTRLMRGVTLM